MITKEIIEYRLTQALKEMMSDYNQEDGFISLDYDPEKEECTVKLTVHIVEEDDYVGFGGY